MPPFHSPSVGGGVGVSRWAGRARSSNNTRQILPKCAVHRGRRPSGPPIPLACRRKRPYRAFALQCRLMLGLAY